MSSVQYDVRKVFGRSVAVPRSSAIPYSGLDDVTIRGLALATLRHRKTTIRRRSCVSGNQPVPKLLHFSHRCRVGAKNRASEGHQLSFVSPTKVGARCGMRLNSPLNALVQPGHQRPKKLAQRRRPFGVLGATGGMAEIAVELEIARGVGAPRVMPPPYTTGSP